MNERFWLRQLPSTDPVFAPLHHAEDMLLESVDTDYPLLAQAHQQAVDDAAWGHSLQAMDVQAEALRVAALRLRRQDMATGGTNAGEVRAAEITALGYALGVTAVRVAIRDRADQAAMGVAA